MPKPQPKPVRTVRFSDSDSPNPSQGSQGQGQSPSVPSHYQPPQPHAPPSDHAPSYTSPEPSSAQPPLESAPPPMPVEQQFERPAIWDAQRYSPPKESMPEMGNSTIEFYQNAWDAPVAQQSQYFHQQHQEQKREPEYPTLPANVVQDQWYQQFTSSVPDRSAVQAVFPWEGKQRQATRVFPRGSTPPPQSNAHKPDVAPVLNVQHPSPPYGSPQRTPEAAPQAPPPRSMAEAMASYTNAWDNDDSIKRYMSRLTGTPLPSSKKDTKSMYDSGLRSVPPTPGPGSRSGSQAQLQRLDSHVSHDTRSSASGDGDDEDEGDDDSAGGEPRSPRVSMRRYKENQRIHSSSSAGAGAGASSTSPNPRYLDKHAQTERQHMQDVGMQVNAPANNPTARTFASAGMREQGVGAGVGAGAPMPAPSKKRDAARPTRSSGSDTPTATSSYRSPTSDTTAVPPIPSTQPASSVPRRVPFPMQQPSTDRVPQRSKEQQHLSGNIGAHSFHPSSGSTLGLSPSNATHQTQGGQSTASPTSVVSNLPTGLPPRSSIDSTRSFSSASSGVTTSPPLALSPLGGAGAGNGSNNGHGHAHGHGRRRESQDLAPSAVDPTGMPSVRASRHFAPETDIGVRKGETLEVLQRLMRGSGNGQ